MLSPIPELWRIAAGGICLLALLPVGTHAQVAARAPSPPHIDELDTAAAAKLLIHVEKPAYPSIAKVNLIHGAVNLEIKVTAKGHVSEAHVIDGEPILAVAALDAVRQWVYRPLVSPEGPAPFLTHVVVKFSLLPHSYKGQLPKDANDYLEKQVRPPEVISRPQQGQAAVWIPMRVLVDAKGEVVDANSSEAGEPEIDLARKSLRAWKFRPARWGAIAVPWYLMVKVPIDRLSLKEVADSAKR